MSLATTPAPKRSLFERVIGLVVEPGQTFAAIVAKPDFVVPVLLMLTTVGFSVPVIRYTTEIVLESTSQPVPQGGNLLMIQVISALVATLLWWPIRAAILVGVGILLGGQPKFKEALAVSGYLNLPACIGAVLAAVSLWVTGDPVTIGLGTTKPVSELVGSPTGVLLTNLNIFVFWYVILAGFGFSELWRVKRSKGFVAAIVMWLLVLGLQVGSAMMNPAMKG